MSDLGRGGVMTDRRTIKIRQLEAENARLRRDALAMSVSILETQANRECACFGCTAARRVQGIKRKRYRNLVSVS